MRNWWFTPTVSLVIVGLLVAAAPVRERLLEERRKSALGELNLAKMPATGMAGLLLMGGFRGVAVDILWMRVVTLHQERRYAEEVSLIELITTLQPYYTSVWIFQGWNIAYNISVQEVKPKDQWPWVKHGINVLKRGLVLNPDDVDLLFYLAHMLRDKVHQNTYFERAMEREMGVNNFEEAARYYKLARHAAGELQTFHPRTVDSGVRQSYFMRIMQIFNRVELTEDLQWKPEDRQKIEHFLDLCRRETTYLNDRWTEVRDGKKIPDAAFMLFPLRDDLIWFDGYLIQAEKALFMDNFSDASIDRARKIVDKAWLELENHIRDVYLPKFIRGTVCATAAMRHPLELILPVICYDEGVKHPHSLVVRNKINEAVGRVPRHLVRMADRLYRRPYVRLYHLERALELCRKALGMIEDAGKAGYWSQDQRELGFKLPYLIGHLEEGIEGMKQQQDRLTPAPPGR